jgi:hypothetical protein
MISQGIPINVVSAILGHSKASVTLDIYSHVYSGRQEQAAALMDELVTPVPVDFSKESFTMVESTEENKGCTRLHPK